AACRPLEPADYREPDKGVRLEDRPPDHEIRVRMPADHPFQRAEGEVDSLRRMEPPHGEEDGRAVRPAEVTARQSMPAGSEGVDVDPGRNPWPDAALRGMKLPKVLASLRRARDEPSGLRPHVGADRRLVHSLVHAAGEPHR